MKIRAYIGKKVSVDRLKQISEVEDKDYFEEGEDRFCVIIEDHQDERGYYFMDVCIDSNSIITQIERNKDIYSTNYIIKRFPIDVEEEAEKILIGLTEGV